MENTSVYTVEELLSSQEQIGKNLQPIVVKMKNRNDSEPIKVYDNITYDQYAGVSFQVQKIEDDVFTILPIQNDPEFEVDPRYFTKGTIFFTWERK